MKRNFKRLTACVLAAIMAFGTTTVAFAEAPAESGTASADGKIEGVVNKDVFRVVLPTVSASNLAFILDPEDLLSTAGANKYQGFTFTKDKGVYFQTTSSTYTGESADFTVINKSTGDVTISITATVTGLEDETVSSTKIALVDSTTIATAQTPSLFLNIVGELYDDASDTSATTGTTAVVDGTAGTVKIASQTLGAPTSAYEVKWTGSEYEYALKDSVTNDDCPRYVFHLEGECNSTYTDNGETKTVNWLAHKDITPTLALAWSVTGKDGAVKKADAQAPSIAQTEYTMAADTAIDVTTNFGIGTAAATKISSITCEVSGSPFELIEYSNFITITGNKITFSAEYVNAVIGTNADRVHTISFADGSNTVVKTINVTFKMPTT